MSNGKQFSKLFNAQIKMMFREKQVWFWNLFFPIILMVLFMIIFGGGSGGDFKAKVALVEASANPTADMLASELHQVPVFEWKSEQPVGEQQAEDWIKSKDIDAAIVLPASEDAKSLKLIVNTENEKNSTSQAISSILNQVVQQTNLAVVGAQPTYSLDVSSISNGSKDIAYVDFLLTGMIALAIAQAGLFGMVEMVELRRKGMLKRLRMTPVKMGLYGFSGMLVRFVLGIVQIVILSVIGVLGFGAHLHIDAITLIIAFLIGGLAFNALGYLISSFSKSMEAYMGIANIASFLMMFLSGIFFATSSLPSWLQSVANVIPLTYFVNGLRDGMVYASGLGASEFWMGTGILALWGAAAYVLGSVIYRRGQVEVR